MKSKLKQLLGFTLLFSLTALLVIIFFISLAHTADVLENIPIRKKEISLLKVTGSVYVYRTDEDSMTIELFAESTEGEVTKMIVWTDSNPDSKWQQMLSFIEIPISDFVYARFQDEFGSLSEVYSDSIYPPQGPPDAPGY